MQNISVDANDFETVLGTPTAQKLIKLLVTWISLSAQDLVAKTKISKSQVHSTLNKLISQNILQSPSRGIYTFLSTPFTELLKEAYRIKIIELINSEIYVIKNLINRNKVDSAERRFSNLVDQYSPILQESFTSHLSSLSLRFIEKMKEVK